MSAVRPAAEPTFRGAVNIGNDSERVTDADEEVFLLYSSLQARSTLDTAAFRGLGYVDSRKDTMTVTFELKAPVLGTPSNTGTSKIPRQRRTLRLKTNRDKTVEVELSQDKTALRSRKGDTGSVLWKASIDFAHLILQQINFETPDTILNPSTLKTQHIVELGAGTGLLAVALAPYVQRYTATDIAALLPLLRKNIGSNCPGWPDRCTAPARGSNIFVQELDWMVLNSTPPTQRGKLVEIETVDLVLVVDCIYHPSLLLPLIETIDYLVVPGRTAVLVVVELRAEDVIREFMEHWLIRPGWEIWRIADGFLSGPYVIWLGWRKEIS